MTDSLKLRNLNLNSNIVQTSAVVLKRDLSTIEQKIVELSSQISNEQPLFSFVTMSDLHLTTKDGSKAVNDDGGHDDLINAFRILKNRIDDKGLNLKYIGVAGDIGFYSKDSELCTFGGIVKQYCPIPASNVFACNGNHDQMHTIDSWKECIYDESIRGNVTDDKNYSCTEGNFIFACMSLIKQSDTNGTPTNGRICYLNDSTKEWLQNIVNESYGKTLILFMHFPFINKQCADTSISVINQYDWETGSTITAEVKITDIAVPYAGLIDRGGNANDVSAASSPGNYGFYVASGVQDYTIKNECEQIIDILNQHNGSVVVFSGHTHTMFQCEDYDNVVGKGYPNLNVAKIPGTNITTVHIPSLNYPRKFTVSSIGNVTGWTTVSGSNRYRQPTQFWIVDAYSNKLILNAIEANTCHDKKYGDNLQHYKYVIDLI